MRKRLISSIVYVYSERSAGTLECLYVQEDQHADLYSVDPVHPLNRLHLLHNCVNRALGTVVHVHDSYYEEPYKLDLFFETYTSLIYGGL